MAVYAYCKACNCRLEDCASPNAHKAAKEIIWAVDVALGGRGGQRIRERTHLTKELAEARERGLQTDYQRGELFPKEKLKKIFFSHVIDRYYVEHCLLHNRNPDRSTKYRLDQMKDLLGKDLIHAITRNDLKTLQNELSREWNPATVNRFFNILKAIFYKAIEWELLETNPCEYIPKLVEDDPIPRFLEKEEIETLRRSVKDQVLADYMTILLHTGARPSSIEECSWDSGDVDLISRTIWFTTYKGRRKHRYPHPIDDSLYELLLRRASWTKKVGWVFDTTNIRRLAHQAIMDSKINEKKHETQYFTIYGLRHCYASHLLMSGASLDEVRRLLGHTDMKMVMKHYGHLTQDHLRKVQSKINLTEDKQDISRLLNKDGM